MLRTNIIAHFASEHSPEREQRLLFAVTPLPQGDEVVGEEELAPWEKPDAENTAGDVYASAESFRTRALGIAPEALVLPRIEDKQELYDNIRNNGALDDKIESIARARGINPDEADGLAKEQISEALLQEPDNALLIARILQERHNKYEEFIRTIGARLGQLKKLSPALPINNAGQLIAIAESLKNRPEGEKPPALAEALGVAFAGNETVIEEINELANDIVKLEIRRNGFAHYDVNGGEEGAARVLARDKEFNSMRKQSNILNQYVDVVLRREADLAYKMHAAWGHLLEEKTGEQLLEELNISPDGLKEVLVENVTIIANITRKNNVDPKLNLPSPSEKDYLSKAEEALEGLKRSKDEFKLYTLTLPNGKEATVPKFVHEKILAEDGMENRVKSIAARAKRVLEKLKAEGGNNEFTEKLESMNKLVSPFAPGENPDPIQRITARTMKPSELQVFDKILESLERTPSLLPAIEANEARHPELEGKNSIKERTALFKRADTLEASLPQLLQHSVCDVTGARTAIRERLRLLKLKLDTSDTFTEGLYPLKNREFADAVVDIEDMEQCQQKLTEFLSDAKTVIRVPTSVEFIQKLEGEADETTMGAYKHQDGKIYVNEEACGNDDEEIQKVITHEKGHGILDIITRRTPILPNLLGELKNRLQEQTSGEDLMDLLRKVAPTWGYPPQSKEDNFKEKLLDELVVQYSDHLNGRETKRTPEELKLFELLRDQDMKSDTGIAIKTLEGISKDTRRGSTMTEEEENADIDKPNPRGTLQELGRMIVRIDSFFEVYPDQLNSAIKSEINDIRKGHEVGKQAFDKNDFESVKDIVDLAKDNAKKYISQMTKFDALRMDLTFADKSQKSTIYKTVFGGVNWLSVSDMITLFNDAGEDIKRMWKRRSESARSTFGKQLFGLIPEATPYLGQLQREFHGREKASEQEEVGVWEKRYEKIDAHVLLHDILPQLVRKDAVKGVVNLLTKKGRMDWNDTHFWDVLEKLSEYHMPHKACIRDPLLRNQYLQKLIANIWDDKDQFEHWKNENDSQIESGKTHFKATFDELSGTSGGLAAKLKYLLKQFRLQKKHTPGIPAKEEEVNPHMYEGILHYAMRNGKMTMEDKIFFLIVGVAEGMFSIDRMKAFVGEQGEVLNSFPVIDFFNGKTVDEVKEMAKRIGSPKAEAPDFRTTDFLMDELRVDDGARKRVQKGKKLVQNWDHEDLPMFVSMLDYKAMNDIVAPTSGSTPKVTDEGMKNIYVGFNTALQYFAMRAKFAKQHHAPFTDEDARQCGTILAAYANYDNRVTIPAPASVRPTLSWTNINNEKPVSSDGQFYTKHYRDALNNFMVKLCETPELNLRIVGNKKEKKKVTNPDGTPKIDDKTLEQVTVEVSKPMGIREYIGVDRGPSDPTPTKYEDCDANVVKFSDTFTTKVTSGAGKQKLIDMLAAMADRFPTGRGDTTGFIPEGYKKGSEGNYVYDNIRPLMEQDGGGHGSSGGHGGGHH